MGIAIPKGIKMGILFFFFFLVKTYKTLIGNREKFLKYQSPETSHYFHSDLKIIIIIKN